MTNGWCRFNNTCLLWVFMSKSGEENNYPRSRSPKNPLTSVIKQICCCCRAYWWLIFCLGVPEQFSVYSMSLIILHHCHSVIPTGQISQRGENHNAILWFLELFGIVGWVVASSLSCLVIWMQTQNFSDSSDKSVLSVCMFLANITQLWPFKMAVWGGGHLVHKCHFPCRFEFRRK